MRYDAIIAGASFAGLAVAARLEGKRVLLLDRKPIGTGQTSACGTLLRTLEALGLTAAVRQIHERLVLHTPGLLLTYKLPRPFCTFDYTALCQLLADRSDAEFKQVMVLGLEGDTARTSDGNFTSDIIVDASGWRSGVRNDFGGGREPSARQPAMSFGIESIAQYEGDDLHFWYDPQGILARGWAWVFPTGSFAHIGLASYEGKTVLRPQLDKFLARHGAPPAQIHGGYFPQRLRPAVTGDILKVGDSAGQCVALTGEGIRPALFFGTRLGDLLRDVLAGERTLDQAKRSYEQLISIHAWGYPTMQVAQEVLTRLPLPLTQGILYLLGREPVWSRTMDIYLRRAFAL